MLFLTIKQFFFVPQGSVLNFILFLIHISDMYKSAPKVCFHLFADDTFLFTQPNPTRK